MAGNATRAEVPQGYSTGVIGNGDNTDKGITNITKARFGVFSYYTGTTDYTVSASESSNPNFMWNQQIIYDDRGYWTYDPVKYWPNGIDADNASTPSTTAQQAPSGTLAGKLSFFAFAPYTAATTAYVAADDGAMPADVSAAVKNTNTNGVKAISSNASESNVWVKYLMQNATSTQAVDLLWGLAGKSSYDETDGVDPSLTVGETYNVNLTKQTVPEKVKFYFKHALAKVGGATSESESLEGDPEQCGFKVVVDVDGNNTTSAAGVDNQPSYLYSSFTNTKTLVTIKSVKIQDAKSASNDANVPVSGEESNLNTFGWFNIETGNWCSESGTYGNSGTGATYNITANNTVSGSNPLDDDRYTLNEKIREPETGESGNAISAPANGLWSNINTGGSKTLKATGVTTELQDVFTDENVPGLLIIPGGTATLYVTVDYIVRTADTNLSQGYTEVEQIITNKVSLGSLLPNKYYTLVMHLGLTSVKFEAIVTDWTLTSDATFNENGNVVEGPTENTEKVWLPSNVVSANQWTITGNDVHAAKGESKALTVTMNSADLTYESAADGKYSLTKAGSEAWLSIESDGKIKTTANTDITKRTAVVNVSTVVNDNTITMPITIEQAGFTFNLTQSEGVVTVKDGDNITVSNLTTTSTWTIEVYDADGVTAAASAYTTAAAGTVTINTAGTYTVKVTYKDSANKTITKTISVTKS